MSDQATHTEQPTISAVLEGGELIELVYLPSEQRTRLAVGNVDDVHIEDSVEGRDGSRRFPLSASNNLIHHGAVLLPSGIESFETPAALAEEVAFWYQPSGFHTNSTLNERFAAPDRFVELFSKVLIVLRVASAFAYVV